MKDDADVLSSWGSLQADSYGLMLLKHRGAELCHRDSA
jgi:hypothetical protein